MSKYSEKYAMLAMAVGLSYDAANDVLYGYKNEYQVMVYAPNSSYPYMLCIYVSARNEYGGALSAADLKTFAKSVKPIARCEQKNNSVIAYMKNQANAEKLKESLGEALGAFTGFLRQKGFVSCCASCGRPGEVSGYRLVNSYFQVCEECETGMRGNLTVLAQQEQQKKENVIGGVVGALLGSLLGVLCIVLLGSFGYVASISGVVMAIGVLKGYEKLGGKLTKKGVVIGFVIMMVMTYFGNQLDWAIKLLTQAGLGDWGFNLFDCYRMVPTMVFDVFREELMSSYVLNLVMIYVFLLLGAVPTIRNRVYEQDIKGTMVKIGSAGPFGN
ncbi:MAG: hypothetical protein NC126_03990 [Clostridium sp.]|nr:hypothetical protein [Clostridium sp.]